jgi:hypothetical protein
MYEYVLKAGSDVLVKTPFNIDFNDIKRVVTQAVNHIISVSTYPNGLVVEIDQYADKIILRSNRELIDNGDGTFTAPEA